MTQLTILNIAITELDWLYWKNQNIHGKQYLELEGINYVLPENIPFGSDIYILRVLCEHPFYYRLLLFINKQVRDSTKILFISKLPTLDRILGPSRSRIKAFYPHHKESQSPTEARNHNPLLSFSSSTPADFVFLKVTNGAEIQERIIGEALLFR